MYLNKVTIIGNLTRDPELKALPSGMQVASMSIATNRTWKDKDGSKKEEVEFHNVVVFGRQAETSAQYLKKGQSVLVEGRLQTRSWEDKTSGEKKYRTEIIADNVQFGSKNKNVDLQEQEELAKHDAKPVVRGVPLEEGVNYPAGDISPEEIPF